MKKSDVWFVIVTYKPDNVMFRQLHEAVRGCKVIISDNTKHNVGYGAAANRGMKEAFDKGATWVVVLNQDVRITQKGITQFCAMAQKCDAGIVGPEAGSLDPTRWTTILPGNKKIDYISGALMAIHRGVWETIGGFYEPYFMYYEDADLCVRARRAGFKLQQVEIDGFSHGIPGQARNDNTKEYYLARNHLLFVWRLAPLSVKLYELIRLPKTLWESLWS